MKFVVTWKTRSGASAADNEAAAARTLEVFGKWSPPSDETFHQFLGRLDGTGGFAVVETDNPDSLAEAPAKFGTYLDFEIIPVNDIGETTRLLGEGVEFRKSVRGPLWPECLRDPWSVRPDLTFSGHPTTPPTETLPPHAKPARPVSGTGPVT